MIIDIKAGRILIKRSSEENIYPYILSQFEFYGFQLINAFSWEKHTQNIESDLNEIISYIDHEEIDYVLTEKCVSVFRLHKEKEDEFNSVIENAQLIKDGVIDKRDFLRFLNFLKALPRKLKEHQIKAALHLYLLKNGANFSVPGSGKTSVVLSVYEKLRTDEEVNVLFVVGPPASFQPWQSEFLATLGRSPNTTILAGGNMLSRKSKYYTTQDKVAELYLTTFHTILRDYNEVMFFFNQQGLAPYLVIDEAHYMKQIGGSWANALLQIASLAKYRCILTGTPMPKSFKDVFNLFDFLYPKNNPLTDSDKIQIDIWENENKNDLAKDLILKKIGPLFYRVRKKDLGLRPPHFHPPIEVEMNSNEARIYNLMKSKVHQLSTKDYLYNEEILKRLWKGRMIRLRQCISYPKLLLKSIHGYKEDILERENELLCVLQDYDSLELPAKLEKLIELVNNLHSKKQKVVIWSNFVGTLKLIKKQLDKNGLRSELIYGHTPIQSASKSTLQKEKTREQIRDEFVRIDSGLNILIANPAAASESISLHKTCFHAIYYDLSYNAAQYLQSLDRIHRVGGSETNIANYYFLQYKNSIDQDIKRNLEIKAKKMYSIIEEDFQIYNLDMFEETYDDDIAAYKRIFHSK
ncbi:DEAD/DEAH box helicase [Prolixibacter denitrificans]|uniref:DNA helicase n=1 Tax=Prolixibacter denitrificans TaxID=1541063 RepID=A0A2P8C5R8_9BACT|nr:DEAD/DEAH box helicase [Prolixibacter denitrificans]PSK80310.1 helicase-like protein [Prolixibacter denitrificans]GET23120.1 DNA helicase [Prolixibacter denitrificans]